MAPLGNSPAQFLAAVMNLKPSVWHSYLVANKETFLIDGHNQKVVAVFHC